MLYQENLFTYFEQNVLTTLKYSSRKHDFINVGKFNINIFMLIKQ